MSMDDSVQLLLVSKYTWVIYLPKILNVQYQRKSKRLNSAAPYYF